MLDYLRTYLGDYDRFLASRSLQKVYDRLQSPRWSLFPANGAIIWKLVVKELESCVGGDLGETRKVPFMKRTKERQIDKGQIITARRLKS